MTEISLMFQFRSARIDENKISTTKKRGGYGECCFLVETTIPVVANIINIHRPRNSKFPPSGELRREKYPSPVAPETQSSFRFANYVAQKTTCCTFEVAPKSHRHLPC